MPVNFEDLQKISLRIGKILEAEEIDGSDKLIKLTVDLGEKNEDSSLALRQIIAGIKKVYEPSSLIGKEYLFVANLEPRVIMGLESQGMILAAGSESGPVLLAPEREIEPGAELK